MGLLWPKCRAWHLALLQLIQLALAHWSSLSRPLCRAFLPLSRLTHLPDLVSSANLVRVPSIPLPRSLIKILNRTGPSSDPWGTPLVTRRQLALTSFTTTLWAWPSSQFFTQQRVHLSRPWAASFSRRMGAERASLVKGASCAFWDWKSTIWHSCSMFEGLPGPGGQGNKFWDLHDFLALSTCSNPESCKSGSSSTT